MHLYFDAELDDSGRMEGYTNRVIEALETLRGFLKQRFGVLEDEINKEYDLQGAFIVIKLPVTKEDKFLIGYHKFSETLKNKLISCLEDNDYIYLSKIMRHAWDQN